MTLEQLLDSVQVYGPIGLWRGNVFACGAAPEVWYDEPKVIAETDPKLLSLEVVGICVASDDYRSLDDSVLLEIGLEWGGFEDDEEMWEGAR